MPDSSQKEHSRRPRPWVAIAKADFLVRTSKIRKYRIVLYPLILAFAFALAILVMPRVMSFVVMQFSEELYNLLSVSFIGFMRSLMVFVWLFALIMPITNSLEGIKIGQWEIILSSNVRTKDILVGSFLGKLPIYGLVIIVLSSVVIAPFAHVYNVSVIGQILMYSVVLLFALGTLWVSNVIGTAMQAKIGESERGTDIGKALSWALIPIMALPSMGIMYFINEAASFMSLDVFALLPSTWCADLVSWITVHFNGVNLPASSIMNLDALFQLGPLIDFILLIGLTIFVVGIGITSADRLFAMGMSSKSKGAAKAGKDNIFLRGIRKAFGASFGTLMVTSLKDFGRKFQNLSKLIYSLFLVSIIPFLLTASPIGSQIDDPIFVPVMVMLTTGMILGIFGAIAFGGIGLMDSKDQLWILKSVPKGTSKFVAARVTSYFLLGIPYAMVPTVLASTMMGYTLQEFAALFVYAYAIIAGAIMIGIGITSLNPAYDDTSSSAFTINTAVTVIVSMAALIVGLVLGLIPLIRREASVVVALLTMCTPYVIVGSIILVVGTIRLSKLEAA